MPTSTRIHRRGFLKRAAAVGVGVAAAPYVVPSAVLGKGPAVAPSERIVMGFIGTGGRGRALLQNFRGLRETQIVAVCDVKRPARDGAKALVERQYGQGSCTAHVDFRELCARDDIDAVAIASCDHWHVLHAMAAVRAGKDVYVEKPLGLSVEQGKALRRLVRQRGAVFQFGTQERSARQTRFACELVLNGRIGEVKSVKVGSRYSRVTPNYPPMPVPDWLDYDLWLGPAPRVPYTPNRVINNC